MYKRLFEKFNSRLFKPQLASGDRIKLGFLEAWISIIGNIFLFAVKYLIGVAIGSIALIADAFHSLADVLSSVAVLLGFYGAKKPADREHPYGHGRIEQIASLVIAALLLWASYGVLREAVYKFIHPADVQGAVGISILLVIFAIFKEWMAVFSLQLAHLTSSLALEGDAWHHRTDAIATFLVSVSILVSKGSLRILDPILGTGVGLLIAYIALKLAWDTVKLLIGKGTEEDVISRINEMAKKFPEIKNIHEIKVHHYGDCKKGSMHIKMNSSLRLETAHRIASQLEDQIEVELGIQIDVHAEPLREKD